MLRELLLQLLRPLAAEAKTGFTNSSVIGGLGGWMRDKTEQLLRANQSGEIAPEAEFRLQRLHILWTNYQADDTNARRQTIAETQRLIEELQPFIGNNDNYRGETPHPQNVDATLVDVTSKDQLQDSNESRDKNRFPSASASASANVTT